MVQIFYIVKLKKSLEGVDRKTQYHVGENGTAYPVWLGLTHLLREAQSHWPPFCLHSQLCISDTRADYQKTRMLSNWDEYFKCLWKLGHFQQAWTCDCIGTITFENGGHCVRALRCHQGRYCYGSGLHHLSIFSIKFIEWYGDGLLKSRNKFVLN